MIHPANNVALSDFRSKVEPLGSFASIQSIPLQAMHSERLIEAIKTAPGDVVAIIRGGLDGMAAFDDKNVPAALAQKRVYRVLGIGHSVTSSLLDLVPEFTAAVPSDAGAHVTAMPQSVSALARQAEESARRLEEAIRELGEARQMASRVPARVEVVNKVPNWAIILILVLTTMLAFLIFVRFLEAHH